jgi:DNA polymerase epsilon subunit 2
MAFLFIGSFQSTPYNMDGSDYRSYTENFNHLADLISDYAQLAETQFIFVPGPNDPWQGDLIPRPRIPEMFTLKMRAKVSNCVFATNPCR